MAKAVVRKPFVRTPRPLFPTGGVVPIPFDLQDSNRGDWSAVK